MRNGSGKIVYMTRPTQNFDRWDWVAVAATVALVLLVGIILLKPDLVQSPTARKPRVAATIFPLYDLTQQIAGDEVEVILLLKPGASPHTFEPTAEEIRNLADAQILFMIGHGLDDWAANAARNVGIAQIQTVDRGIQLSADEERENGVNPHYWLTIPHAQLIAQQIHDSLARTFPDRQKVLQQNLDRLRSNLATADTEIRNRLAVLPTRQIATFHDAWTYFADEYELEVVSVFEEFPGKEPTPQYLAKFQEQIRTRRVPVIFSEPQLSTATLTPIATDLGVTIVTLDPIGGVDNRDNFINLMLFNAEQIANAFK